MLFQNKNGFLTKSRMKKTASASVKLTSLLDMMTILLVFLLKNFSAEGQIMIATRDLRLPESTAQKQPRVSSVVAITQDFILLDGKPLAKIPEVVADKNLIILPLFEELKQLRALTEGIAELSADIKGFTGDISIQGDKEIPFELLKRIMFTCGQTGFTNMMLVVNKYE